MYGTVFDVEADSLTPTKIYCMAASGGDEPHATTDPDKMRELLLGQDVLVGHNIARWDIPNLERLLEIEIPEETLIVDTLAVSWYLYPDRKPNHKLESFGVDFGIPKPEINDWLELPIEEYIHRCVEDVKINTMLWKQQYETLLSVYGSHSLVVDFLKYLAFKMRCARMQEESRWKLDIDTTQTSLQKLESLKKEKTYELGLVLPKIRNTRLVAYPKRAIKANGKLSVIGERWSKLVAERGLPPDHVDPIEITTGYDDPNPSSPDQVKQWLFSLGWEPDVYKTNDKGKEVPQVNKLKQDGGGLSDSVLRLIPDNPSVELLDSLGILGHRIGILHGFLSTVSSDGFVAARIQGLTNTLRFKHAECVNLPKIDALYGQDVRGALIAPDGHELCGSDMSSLEDRTKQHYMWKYDPDYVRDMMGDDFDPHLDIAVVAGLMTKVDSEFYKKFKSGTASHAEHTRYKILKSIRGIAKNANYACVYGAGAAKISKTAGIPLNRAGELHTAYWKRNWSVKAVGNACKTKQILQRLSPVETKKTSWLYNPVSKFWYSLRNEKDKFSTLNQGTGVFCFDTYVGYILYQRPQITGQFHDEIILTVKQGFRENVVQILRQAIDWTNEKLQLNRTLDVGIDFGSTYAEIH